MTYLKRTSSVLACVLLLAACTSEPPSFGDQSTEPGEGLGNDPSEPDSGAEAATTGSAAASSGASAQGAQQGNQGSPDTQSEDAGGPAEEQQQNQNGEATMDDMGGLPPVNTSEEPTPPTDSAMAALGLGDSCTEAQQCESGYCADGVCCDSDCAGVCAECNATGTGGTCTAAVRDEACGVLACPSDTECRTYDSTDAGNCDGIGQCATTPACIPMDVATGTACQDGAGTCDGAGECVIPDKAMLGESCSANDECGSDFCAPTAAGGGVCCNQACTGVCEACGANGFCEDVPADDSRCQELTCPTDSSCASYPETLTQNRCATFGQCVTQAAHCVPTFADSSTSCGTGQFCDGQGDCEDACGAGQTWCSDACVDLNQDDDNCGECGTTCPTGQSCVSGSCECDGSSELMCSGGCVNPNTDDNNCGSCGTSCASLEECQSGDCVCSAGSNECQGTCYDNDDDDHCGSGCYDCSTFHGATGTCSSGACSCKGAALACLSDEPSCGTWDFEDNTVQGWRVGAASNVTITAGPLVRASGGSTALAVDFSTTTTNYELFLEADLCPNEAALDLSGKTLSFDVRVTQPGGGSTTVNGIIMGPSFCQFNFDTNTSYSRSCNLSSGTATGTVGLQVQLPQSLTGTIYVDNVEYDE